MMKLFFLTTLAICLSLISACDNFYVNLEFQLEPPEGSECTHQDTQKIMRFVTKAMERNADKFLKSKGVTEKFGDFSFEEVRRRDLLLEGEDEEMTVSQEYERVLPSGGFGGFGGGFGYSFDYNVNFKCGWICGNDDSDDRRSLGFLRRRTTNSEVIDWDEFETFMNDKMPKGLKGIMKSKPTSEDCVDESLGDWSGHLVWESSTCAD